MSDLRFGGPPGRRRSSRVLIVDDEPKTLLVTRDILELDGFAVDTAASVAEALACVEPGRFQAVLTDIRMPGGSGLDLLAALRARDHELPVVIVTGYATLETATKAVEQGAFHYMLKPVDFDVLRATMRRATERYELLVENRRLFTDLKSANQALAEANRHLEDRVEERTLDLALERDLLEAVFATIPSALCLLDTTRRDTRRNAGWRKLGPSLAPALLVRLGGQLDKIEAGCGSATTELGIDGRTFRATILRMGERRLVVLDELTESRRLEDQLIQAEKLACLGTLASGIVHDLANPVTAILGAVELLRDDTEAASREDLEAIGEAAAYMRELCLGLNAFARRAESGGGEPCDVNAIVLRALSFVRFSRRVKERGVETANDLVPALPPVAANATELLQVILNLVTNAADASPKGGRIEVRTRYERGRVVIEVGDDGPGVPVEMRERIFEPFFTTKDASHGTGLGLYICRRIITRQGGTIEVASGAGGAVFRVAVPIASGAALRATPRPHAEGSGARARGMR